MVAVTLKIVGNVDKFLVLLVQANILWMIGYGIMLFINLLGDSIKFIQIVELKLHIEGQNLISEAMADIYMVP